MIHGILNVLKPPGMTSHDVVGYVRRLTGIKRVGHTGTLDPAAVGVLPICVGLATRLVDYITDQKKAYRAEITLGTATDSGDALGEIVSVCNSVSVSQEDIETVLSKFLGNILQVPPMTSAIKINGKKLYELARQGIEIERPARKVIIYKLEAVKWDLSSSPPRFLVDIDCSKGTYIRSLCTDIGTTLGCGAYMSFLVRTKVGSFRLEDALTLEELQDSAQTGDLITKLVSMERALVDMPKLELNELQARDIDNGRTITVIAELNVSDEIIQLHFEERLLAIAQVRVQNGAYVVKPIKVFHR